MELIIKEIISYSMVIVQMVTVKDEAARKELENDADLKMETIKNLIKLSQQDAVIKVLNESINKLQGVNHAN